MMQNSSTDALYDIAQRYIDDRSKKLHGTVYDWDQAKAEEFSRVPIETLIKDPYYLGLKDTVYDGVMEDIVDLFNERKKRTVNLAIFLEGIGSGKTLKASIILWLLWYELALLGESPQEFFDLAPDSIIAFINMNRTEKQAKKVTFTEVMNRFQTGFNKDYFPIDENYTSEIRISRNKTTIFPGTSSALSALGYNLYGGVIDEACFLEVIDDSTKAFDGRFDAAEEMYHAIMNRMTSRFLRKGVLPGMLCMISSPNFPDDFMHRQIEKAKEFQKIADEKGEVSKSGIFWRRRPMWEAKGPKFFPENEFFYIDTENAEIIADPKTLQIMNLLNDGHFPVELDAESLEKVAQYYRPDEKDLLIDTISKKELKNYKIKKF